jgi:hypothetical protein
MKMKKIVRRTRHIQNVVSYLHDICIALPLSYQRLCLLVCFARSCLDVGYQYKTESEKTEYT